MSARKAPRLTQAQREILCTAVFMHTFKPLPKNRADCERLTRRGLLARVSCHCGGCKRCNGTFRETIEGRKALFGETW